MENAIHMLPVTGLYAALFAIMLCLLSLRVIQFRRLGRVSLGDGDDVRLARAIRGQANFVEYAPIGLILLAAAELNGMPGWLLHAYALALLAGRLMHAYAFSIVKESPIGRTGGMMVTFSALLAMAVATLFWVLA
ncbi:MAG: MAPEG family protein [Alphaproteobacteria bacterium]|nr:MAPEG family protein [Alphaproteobacteria bacterium]